MKSHFHTNQEEDSLGCLWMVLSIIIGAAIAHALFAVFELHNATGFDKMVCAGATVGFVILSVKAITSKHPTSNNQP